MNCYIDTITIYKETITTPLLNNSLAMWKFYKKADKAEEHFFIRYQGITCRYYPHRYGIEQLRITCSVPKLLKGNNLYPINMNNLDMVLYQKVSRILMDIVTLTPATDYDISIWEVSRLDLFLLHRINPKQRKWYLNAYSKLSIGSYIPYQHKNTFYLNSTIKRHRAAGTVVRIYPKLQELHDTSPFATIPSAIEKDFEYYMELNDELHDYIRLEFQFRRQTLRYFFHHATSVTVADVIQEQFQIERINRMLERLGLHRPIIGRKRMKEQLALIFTKQPTRQRAGQYISLINARGTYQQTIRNQFSEGQIRYIRQKLHQHNLHTVISEFEDLEPIERLE